MIRSLCSVILGLLLSAAPISSACAGASTHACCYPDASAAQRIAPSCQMRCAHADQLPADRQTLTSAPSGWRTTSANTLEFVSSDRISSALPAGFTHQVSARRLALAPPLQPYLLHCVFRL